MKMSTLVKAQEDALRFIERVNKLRQDADVSRFDEIAYGRDTASVKRSSMDLTRVLADLRLGR